jgi:hypothetical protein
MYPLRRSPFVSLAVLVALIVVFILTIGASSQPPAAGFTGPIECGISSVKIRIYAIDGPPTPESYRAGVSTPIREFDAILNATPRMKNAKVKAAWYTLDASGLPIPFIELTTSDRSVAIKPWDYPEGPLFKKGYNFTLTVYAFWEAPAETVLQIQQDLHKHILEHKDFEQQLNDLQRQLDTLKKNAPK